MTAFRNNFRVRSKVWLEIDSEPFLGQGREELLRQIARTGSINAAAKTMAIPYRKAWTYLDTMEKRLGFPLVIRQRGGTKGGESALTPEAIDILGKFDQLRAGVQEVVDRKFAEIFSR